MTTSTPPGLHEQLAALDEVEQALVQLTTADLEGVIEPPLDGAATTFHPAAALETVIPAQAGTHAECDVPAKSKASVTQRGDGSRPAPG
jgi:hypothetical protein